MSRSAVARPVVGRVPQPYLFGKYIGLVPRLPASQNARFFVIPAFLSSKRLLSAQYRSRAHERQNFPKMHKFWTRKSVVLSSIVLASIVGYSAHNDRTNYQTDENLEVFEKYTREALITENIGYLSLSAFIYSALSFPTVIDIGKSFIHLCDLAGLSWLYKPFIKATFYKYFCGGETENEIRDVMNHLAAKNVSVSLNYGIEADVPPEGLAREDIDKFAEETVEKTLNYLRKTIELASISDKNSIPIKLTSLVNVQALKDANVFLEEEISNGYAKFSLIDKLDVMEVSNPIAAKEIKKAILRLDGLADYAKQHKVRILFDAEQSYFQTAIDALCLDLSKKFNKNGHLLIYNTYQMYLKRSLGLVKMHLDFAREHEFNFGIKLVRGAYMFSEPAENRPLFHDTKRDTDDAYNSTAQYLVETDHKLKLGLIIASHNASTVCKISELVLNGSMSSSLDSVEFAQLYGMADGLTIYLSNLSRVHPSIRSVKYLVWGGIDEALPYLIRRADENTTMLKSIKLERNLILREIIRRGKMAFHTLQVKGQ